MKALAYILLTVALAGGALSGYLWWHHSQQAHEAAAKEQQSLATEEQWETSEALELHNAQGKLSNDELSLTNDHTEVEIAQLEGHSTATARNRAALDEAKISADRMYLGILADTRAFGPSKHVSDAQQSAAAAHGQVIALTAWTARDERFVYCAVGLLVASGFAFGFAQRKAA